MPVTLFRNRFRKSKKHGHIKLIALGNSILANNRYAGGPGRSAPELLLQNNDNDFPDFHSNDLKSLDPEAELIHLAQDGATFQSVVDHQLGHLPARQPDDLIVALIAIGGNDLLQTIQQESPFSPDTFSKFTNQLHFIVDYIQDLLSPEIVLIANTYDPTGGDGTVIDATYADVIPVEAARIALQQINGDVARFCQEHHFTLVDLHRAFFGHGFNQSEPWITQHIEPNYQGSHAIRSLIWPVLVKALVNYGFNQV